METRRIGIIMNGVTGRMGTNQHLKRSILAIIEQGGIKVSDDLVLMPDPILTGRNPNKLQNLAQATGVEKWTTDIDGALGDGDYQIFFDASGTNHRVRFVEKAVAAGKSVYCEKPIAVATDEAVRLAKLCEDAGLKNGVVQDKLWLPGMRKYNMIKDQGFFGDLLSVRGEFGYWVFTGHHYDQAPQRPSWNYRKGDGGGMIVDMLCHWRYVVDNLFGNITAVNCLGATHIGERIDENGKPFTCDTDDSCYATFELDNGVICHFNCSWATRVRRDDLLTMHVDGTDGSAMVGLRKVLTQSQANTPKPVWNPDIDNPIDFFAGWQEVPDFGPYDNAFKIQWELFLRHVALDEPFRWTLREGAKGVQLAELGLESWRQRKWLDVPGL
ncbi:MAG: Gfo/Idh/MocA family protein [Planctomycetota bacterium]